MKTKPELIVNSNLTVEKLGRIFDKVGKLIFLFSSGFSKRI